MDLDVSIVTQSIVNEQFQEFHSELSNLAVAIHEQYLVNSIDLQLTCT